MANQYGIPYMGSKQKIAESICALLPKAENFYDLFGGGFSITHCMLLNRPNKYKNFHYNEINADIVDLVKRAISGEFNYNRYKPEWISREDFFKRKDNDALVRCLWSFGNNQKGYLFGDIEKYKKSMHMAIVFDEFDDLARNVFGFSTWPKIANTIYKKRIYLRQKIEFYRKTKIPKILHQFLNEKQLEQLEQLERLEQLRQLQQLQQLQQLHQLQQLRQLQQLQQLQRLNFYSDDYRKIEILPNSIVYCDPPYAGTADYLHSFNTSDFLDWASTRDFPVFISEYEIKDDRFELFYEIEKRSLLSSKKDLNIKKEKIYWNKKNLTP